MSSLVAWWSERSDEEKIAIGVIGGIVVIATGGAFAYAIAAEGAVLASGETIIAIGAAATTFLHERR